MSNSKQWQKAGKLIQSLAASMELGKGGKGKPAVWKKSSKGNKCSKADKGNGKGTKGGQGGPKGGKGPLADAPGTHPPCRCCGLTNHAKRNCKHLDKACSICNKTGHL